MDYALEHAKAAVYIYQLAMLDKERYDTLICYAQGQAITAYALARDKRKTGVSLEDYSPYHILREYLTSDIHFIGKGG